MGHKILIVDDEAHIRLLIAQTLEKLEDDGVEILTAADGAGALDTILAEQPDLVFLDVMMPQMNGFDVCRRVKRELGLPVYIVLLTAKGQAYDKQQGEDVGADMYMTKPFDPGELRKKAAVMLGLQ